jgi:hypothetical protein
MFPGTSRRLRLITECAADNRSATGAKRPKALCDGANVPGDFGSRYGLDHCNFAHDSKVKRLTIKCRDLGIARLGISHQYSAPELAWPCVF